MENKLNHNPRQTAVNWVIQEIMRHQMTMYGTASIPLYILQKAIQLEKEQIEDAYQAGQDNVDYTACFVDENGLENYYEQTYGGNK